MNKIFTIIATLLILTSCTQKTEIGIIEEQNPEQAVADTTIPQEESRFNFLEQVSSIYTGDASFRVCLQNQVDTCIIQKSESEDKQVQCDDLLLESNRVLCMDDKILLESVTKKDISICENLSRDKEFCQYEIIVSQAVENNYNVEICETVGEKLQFQCHNTITLQRAIAEKSIKVCDAVQLSNSDDQDEKDFCVEQVTNTIR